MNIEDNDIMHCLEWPPTIHNFSLYNIIEFILIFVFGCYGGYQVYKIFRFGTYELTDWLGLIIYGMIFLGACLSFFGLLEDDTNSMKIGFIIFCIGGPLIIIKTIYDWFKIAFSFYSLIEICIALILSFVCLKQIQHL